MQHWRILLFTFTLIGVFSGSGLLSACGAKGDLFLPESKPVAKPPVAKQPVSKHLVQPEKKEKTDRWSEIKHKI